MDNNKYKEDLLCAAETLNERMGTEFSEDNLVLCCFQTENQQEVFEQFCKQYFPERLTDRYKEDGYFDFHASAFVGEGENRVDGVLLRTDVERTPVTLYHILLHELAHIFCTHNELGGRVETFLGLTGMGDLIVTCTSMHSRNRKAGYLIGKGKSREEAVEEVGMIVEGIKACNAFYNLKEKLNVEMPITDALYKVLFEGSDPREMVSKLLQRDKKAENY